MITYITIVDCPITNIDFVETLKKLDTLAQTSQNYQQTLRGLLLQKQCFKLFEILSNVNLKFVVSVKNYKMNTYNL